MKKIIFKAVLFLSIISIASVTSKAQSLSGDDIKSQLLKEWERAKVFTIDYLNTMPADKYSFKAQDSIRSFAQQMLHLAGGNIFLMMNATDAKVPSTF